MKKNRTKYYLTTIMFVHILVYFFKIDRDIFSFQEYFNQPNQTYTEQPQSKIVSYFCGFASSFQQFSKFEDTRNSCIAQIAIWNSISLSYNSRVRHFLKFYQSPSVKMINFISVLFRQNIFHKSSEDVPVEYRLFA